MSNSGTTIGSGEATINREIEHQTVQRIWDSLERAAGARIEVVFRVFRYF